MFGKPAENGKPAIDGAIKRGVKQEVAEKIWGEMESFASYAFNKSHAAAYSIITYETAYLKNYYEAEFLTAVLNNRISNADEIKNYINHAKDEKIKVLPPDVNKSKTYFSVKNKQIRFGLAALKGIGETMCDQIVAEREANGEYKNFADFLSRCYQFGVNKRVLESMIFSGAFDCFKINRSVLFAVYDQALKQVSEVKKKTSLGQISLFGEDEIVDIKYPELDEYDNFQKLNKEKEIIGIYISGHPLDAYRDKFENFTFNASMFEPIESENTEEEIGEGEEEKNVEYGIADGTKITAGGIVTEVRKSYTKVGNKAMAVIEVEDLYGSYSVMVFPKIYDQIKYDLAPNKIITINGKVNIREGEKPIIVPEKIEFWNQEIKSTLKKQIEEESISVAEKLYLKYNIEDQRLNDEILGILSLKDGKVPVLVQSNGKMYNMNVSVTPTTAMLSELTAVLGVQNIKLK